MHPRALRSLTAVADTLLPGSDDSPSAVALGVVDRFEPEILQLIPDAGKRRDLLLLLHLLGMPVAGVALHRSLRPFTSLGREAREVALRRLAASPIPKIRLGFKALKGTLGALYMNPASEDARPWPPWRQIGYAPVVEGPTPLVEALDTTVPQPGATWQTDVVVVGSGAGGGPAAAVLAAAGLDVVVVEKGGYHDRGDFPRFETDALHALYMGGGLATTSDGAITLLAGETLGGGTVVNYATAFPTPDRLREEWDRVAGFDEVFTGSDFARSMDLVARRIAVTVDEGDPSPRDRLLEIGLTALGWHVGVLPRNVDGCDPGECGMCSMGCRIGAKQSSLETWLRDAAAAGARLVVGADVEVVLVEEGRAVGVVVATTGDPMTIRARAVVMAAGGLHSPAILLRSGVDAVPIGGHLRLHPATAVWGRFPERVEQWKGTLQARYSDEFADLDGEGYGFKFETTAVHQSFPPLLFGWESGASFHEQLAEMAHWTLVGILLRDRGGGRARLGGDGTVRWHYRFDRRDLDHMAVAFEKGAEVLAAAGAEEVLGSTLLPVRWRPREGGSAADFAYRLRRMGLGANRTAYVSFHQMGSARMGSVPSDSAVGADNEVHGVRGLYVVDASAFPTASGVNPAFTVQAIAHRAATLLAERLT